MLSAAAASVKRNTTHGLYIFTLRQLHENIVHKYISIGVASILIMLTIMLIADGYTHVNLEDAREEVARIQVV